MQYNPQTVTCWHLKLLALVITALAEFNLMTRSAQLVLNV